MGKERGIEILGIILRKGCERNKKKIMGREQENQVIKGGRMRRERDEIY